MTLSRLTTPLGVSRELAIGVLRTGPGRRRLRFVRGDRDGQPTLVASLRLPPPTKAGTHHKTGLDRAQRKMAQLIKDARVFGHGFTGAVDTTDEARPLITLTWDGKMIARPSRMAASGARSQVH